MFSSFKVPVLAVVLVVAGLVWNYLNTPRYFLDGTLLPPSLGTPASIEALTMAETAEPVQIAVLERNYMTEGYVFTPLAAYSIQNKILSVRRYNDYWGNISPMDLVLAWGPMTRPDVLDTVRYSQSNRWWYYRYRLEELPISPQAIAHNAANVHIIPASQEVWSGLLKNAKRGRVLRANGYLVRVTAPDGGRWTSSLSRTDTGDGACEVFLVTDFVVY